MEPPARSHHARECALSVEAGQTVELAGVSLASLSRAALEERVFSALERGFGGWVITANVDHLRRYQAEPELRALCAEADWVVADGMPLLWAAKLQGTPLPERVAGSDLVWSLAERAAAEGRSLYLLGGDPGVAEAAADELRGRWPGLRIVGCHAPWISAEPSETELAPIRERLLAARPDLVYVGLGAPKQEHLIRALRTTLPASWWVGVGISLSFISGDVQRAPRWMHRLGLEWLYRMLQEPGRLIRRYLVDDLPFAVRLLAASLKRRWTCTR